MKRLITFSLWGDNPFYTEGAYRNAELAKEIYPDWICRFYVAGKNTPQEVIDKLQSYDNTEDVVIETPAGMLDRMAQARRQSRQELVMPGIERCLPPWTRRLVAAYVPVLIVGLRPRVDEVSGERNNGIALGRAEL